MDSDDEVSPAPRGSHSLSPGVCCNCEWQEPSRPESEASAVLCLMLWSGDVSTSTKVILHNVLFDTSPSGEPVAVFMAMAIRLSGVVTKLIRFSGFVS